MISWFYFQFAEFSKYQTKFKLATTMKCLHWDIWEKYWVWDIKVLNRFDFSLYFVIKKIWHSKTKVALFKILKSNYYQIKTIQIDLPPFC